MKSAELQRRAQRRADRITAFRAELAELERERGLVLTPGQRSHLDAHYRELLEGLSERFDVDIGESGKRVSWAMRIGCFLAGVALFAAFVLFCHRIWGLLPSVGQVVIAVGGPLALLATTELAYRSRIARYYVTLLALASGASFVTALNALGSSWNTEPSANALLAWALFALLLAYAYQARVLLAAALLLLCAYSSAIWITLHDGYWLNFLDQGGLMMPAAALIYVMPWVTSGKNRSDFHVVYHLCGGGGRVARANDSLEIA